MGNTDFNYKDERFADIAMLRYRVKGWDSLTPRQRTYVYHLSEAALWGRDILWDQNCRLNLRVRHMLEGVYAHYHDVGTHEGDAEWQALVTYLKRVWFSNGIHHHYGCGKFVPEFTEGYLRQLLDGMGQEADGEVMRVIFDPSVMPKRVNQAEGEDLVLTSACNYYGEGVTQAMAEAFYNGRKDPADERPVMYGMNSRLELDANGQPVERVWKSGGMYGQLIDKIMEHLAMAREASETEAQRRVIDRLLDFYRDGDLRTFDEYCIEWVDSTGGDVDFVIGFTETYGDPLGMKASWEGYVNIIDKEATGRTETLAGEAQWFEDHSPVDPRFKKKECRGVTAKVVEAVQLGGDLYPSSAIGINLPNSNWVRAVHGSKSVTIGNLTEAYAKAAKGSGFREEFVIDKATVELLDKYDDVTDDLHTDLHECLGHGSGRLLPGTDPDALKAYASTIEEARADLFALYYIADGKLTELGLTPDREAWKSQYYSYMMNGLMTQLVRIEPGKQIEEAHMRNRALIAHWCLAHADGAMALVKRDGKTFVQISDYGRVRSLVAQLLAEVQRVKSEGDLEAARNLVEEYGVRVDPALHKEVRERYKRLNLAPYKGFINPVLTPVRDKDGQVVDANITYGEPYDKQMLRYSHDYSL